VPDESDEKDISVYLGLAAAAFLLVMLYPSNTTVADISLRPAAQAATPGSAQEPFLSCKGSGRPRMHRSPSLPSASDAVETSSVGSGLLSRPVLMQSRLLFSCSYGSPELCRRARWWLPRVS
jgi:hypothetical protein